MGRRATEFEVVRIFEPDENSMKAALEYIRDLPVKSKQEEEKENYS